MPRPILRGHISFGLVMVPIALYSAETPLAELDLDMLDERDQARVRFKRVNEETGEEVPWKSVVKGYKAGGKYVILDKKDFEQAANRVTRGVELLGFVEPESISPIFYEKPYYVGPGKGGEKGYALLRDAIEQAGVVGVAKLVIHTKQHLAALTVVGNVLTLITLRFTDELRSPKEIEVPKARITPRELEMGRKLVEAMTAKWEPRDYHDEYRDALLEVIHEKSRPRKKELPAAESDREEAPTSYNMMELLRRSVEEGVGGGRSGSRRHGQGSQHTRARRAHTRRKAG